jgi:hypothetical protein
MQTFLNLFFEKNAVWVHNFLTYIYFVSFFEKSAKLASFSSFVELVSTVAHLSVEIHLSDDFKLSQDKIKRRDDSGNSVSSLP